MFSPAIYANIDHSVYSRFITGAFPITPIRSRSPKSPFQLVKSANAVVVNTSPSKEQIEKELLLHDFTFFGYHTTADYELKIIYESECKCHQAKVVPLKIYDLQENMLLPVPPNLLAKIFLDFFSDEFERIKIRSEKVLSNTSSEKAIHIYAIRNMQLARKLFHDATFLFHSLSLRNDKSKDESELYIVYILNLFIIRTLVFYSKFFRPFLDAQPLSEEKLRNELLQEAPIALKYPWLFDQKPRLYGFLHSMMAAPAIGENIAPYSNPSASGSDPDLSPASSQFPGLHHLKGKVQLKCNVNTFVDIFYQMMYEKKAGNDSFLSCELSDLVEALAFLFVDKDGNSLNPDSIRTILKPANFKKRPHPDDPRKLKI